MLTESYLISAFICDKRIQYNSESHLRYYINSAQSWQFRTFDQCRLRKFICYVANIHS